MEEGDLADIAAESSIDMDRMTPLLESQLYGGLKEVGSITIKELAQNAFDAIKDSYIALGNAKGGSISIDLDSKARTITVTDTGAGMTPEIINEAFLRLAGTHKETDDPSGSFGVAKMLFLYGNKSLKVTTVRDGVEARWKQTGRS
jgi:sensor histidine kinase regulating citrate/malate metabolism